MKSVGQNSHYLANRQFVEGEVSKAILVYPQTEAFTRKTIYKFGTTEQLTDYESEQFGIAFLNEIIVTIQ